jgi:hypothetical protein
MGDGRKRLSGAEYRKKAKFKKKTNNNLLFRRCNCAMFVPCAAHSLNVVGTSAAEFSTEACHFFMLLEEVSTLSL